ncbi:MAG: hypothetical protein NTY09_14100 [bacterium]|nr:hypothetical protein [bacterium]
MKKAPDIPSQIKASPSNALFLHAWTRIWDGDPGRGVRFWETFFWSVLAVFAGFTIFGWVDPLIVRATAWITYAILILLTPLAIGTWVYRVHTSVGSADESLRALPLKPREILLPRMRAVLFTWVRIFLPILLLVIEANLIPLFRGIFDPIWALSGFYYSIFNTTKWHVMNHVVSESRLVTFFLVLATPCYIIGYVTAPLAWGFWLATRFRLSSAGYFFNFMSYYLCLGGIFWVGQNGHGSQHGSVNINIGPFIYEFTYLILGLTLLIMTWLCYSSSCYFRGRQK